MLAWLLVAGGGSLIAAFLIPIAFMAYGVLAIAAYYIAVKSRQVWLRHMFSRLDKDAAINAAALMVRGAKSVVVFTGAGISVESGIPDFRSPGGLWSRYSPMKYCEYNTFLEQPHLFWQFARELVRDTHTALGGNFEELQSGNLRTAKPNTAHKAIAELEQLGFVRHVVTQNVDGLHQEAGSTKVIEVHGSMATCSCIETKRQVSQSEVLRQWSQFVKEHPDAQIVSDRWVPRHSETGGVLKADVTFFGEALPTGAFSESAKSVLSSSVVLVVGTSLNVMPAGLIPSLIKLRLGRVIIVNCDRSGADGASLYIQGSAGDVIPKIVEKLKTLQAS